VIGLLPTTAIFLATAPTDLRKAYDGLAVLVRQSLGQDPLSGSLYVFCNRRRDRIKILFWEEGGYWLCARRLEEGTFRWPQKEGACARYRREELLLLLGGIDLEQTREKGSSLHMLIFCLPLWPRADLMSSCHANCECSTPAPFIMS